MDETKALQPVSTSLTHFEDQQRMAKAFHQSGLWEDVKDMSQALVKIMKGSELGLPPVASMSAFHIIQKQLFVSAQTCGALLRSKGYADYTAIESNGERCVIRFSKRTHEGWISLPDVSYTLDMAKARGLTTRSPEWKTDPANMLFWRALTRGVRRYFPEVLSGLPTSEDLPPVSDKKAQETINELYGEPVSEKKEAIDAKTGEVLDDVPDGDVPEGLFDKAESAAKDQEDN